MRAAEAAGRAMYLVEHPHATRQTWGMLNMHTQLYWIQRAAPIAMAVVLTMENR